MLIQKLITLNSEHDRLSYKTQIGKMTEKLVHFYSQEYMPSLMFFYHQNLHEWEWATGLNSVPCASYPYRGSSSQGNTRSGLALASTESAFVFRFISSIVLLLGSPDSSAAKESTCNAGESGSIPGSGRSAGEGISYPLQYSGLEKSMGSQRVRHDWATFTFTWREKHYTAGFIGLKPSFVSPWQKQKS